MTKIVNMSPLVQTVAQSEGNKNSESFLRKYSIKFYEMANSLRPIK